MFNRDHKIGLVIADFVDSCSKCKKFFAAIETFQDSRIEKQFEKFSNEEEWEC